MILRQLFDHETYTFSYLIACEKTREALVIDPVASQVELIEQYLNELDLTLSKTFETHVHADHVTGAGKLREKLKSESYSAVQANVECASHSFNDQDIISLGSLSFKAIYTPGHTDDSYCFLLEHGSLQYLFSGDTLLIRGTGRTDFQNGDPNNLYKSLQSLLQLSDSVVVYPGHDYNGRNLSTIGEERAHNPRLINKSENEFVKMMNKLTLPKPKFIDIAVPANQACGKQVMEAGE